MVRDCLDPSHKAISGIPVSSYGWVQQKSREGGSMLPLSRFGEAVPRNFDGEVVSDGDAVPGLGWQISEDTQRALQAMEENIRTSEQRSGAFRLD
jgi:hypothetical protein